MTAPDHSKPGILRALSGRNTLLLLALLVIGLIFEWLTRDSANSFLSARSVSTVFVQASVIGVLACGMTFIIILTHIDLSVGSAIAFLGALAAWMMAPRPVPGADEGSAYIMSQAPSGLGWPAVVVFLAIVLVGMALWGAKGLLQVKTGMPAFIITLGGMMGYRGLAYLVARREIPVDPDNFISSLGTGYLNLGVGWVLLAVILAGGVWRAWRARLEARDAWYMTFAPALLLAAVIVFLQMEHEGVRTATRGIAYLTLLWGVAAFIMSHVAEHTVFGRHLYATGGNREAASLCGVHTARVTVMAFVSMGILTALASLMYVGQQGTAESSAGNMAELDAIAACVLGGVSLMGGRGSVSGAVLGALIMQSLTSGLYQCNVETGYQMLIKAAVLVVVVALDHAFRKQ
jgi:D-xylose transport system permease protein